MKVVEGDLLKLAKDFDVIVHGCNCHHTMGAGIARQIKRKYPQAFEADKTTVKGHPGKLGHISQAVIDHSLTVVNAYAQFNLGPDLRLDALRACFRKIKQLHSGKRIAYPRIGAGLAGGDWEVISKIIDEELEGEDHTLVEYKK